MHGIKGIIFLMLLSTGFSLCGQRTVISGKITDAETGEAIPFVNIGFLHSITGTISEMDGSYYLSALSSSITDTLIVSSIGYEVQRIFIQRDQVREINVSLETTSIMLDEVIVRPGGNPAFRILDSIMVHKDGNNPDNYDAYQYHLYAKLRLDFNNIDDNFRSQRIFRDFGFVFDYMDSSAVFNKNYLPVLISETLSRYYHSKDPPVRKEVIDAFKISGIENNTVSQYSGKMYQKLNVYDNFIRFFDPGFVSPIADFGKMYYKYFLEDSSFIDGSWCYKISFKPRRKQERTFYGHFWVADTVFAIKQVQLRVSADVNVNLIKDMVAVNTYKKVNDSLFFLSQEDLVIDFNIAEQRYGFFGRKTAVYDRVELNAVIPDSILGIRTDTWVPESLPEKDDDFWEQYRKGNLTEEDRDVYAMVDSVKRVPVYKRLYALGHMLAGRYLVMGPVEVGPYYTLVSNNELEGMRIRLGGRTSPAFSTSVRLGGHAAYGFRDEAFKYGLDLQYIFKTQPRISLKASHAHDVRQLGKSENAFLDDNFFASLLRRRPNDKLTMVDQYNLSLEREWLQGFSNTLSFRYQAIRSTSFVPFISVPSPGDTLARQSLTSSEIRLSTHFAYREKFLLGAFERVSLGTKSPALDLHLTWGIRGLFGSDYEFARIEMTVSDKIEVNPLGHLKIRLTAGRIFGTLPYPLLKLHEGNETYAYDPQSFNMMNYYEFVSDAWVHLFAEQHFQGFFLNRIPLLRQLHLREVLSCNILAGRLDQGNRNVMEFPEGLYALDKPYYEASAGIENIFKFIRVDAVWRLSYLDHADVQHFGIRGTMQFSF